MKLLMFQAERFAWRPFQRVLPDAEEAEGRTELSDAAVIFVHAEASDQATRSKTVTKAIKNIKWLARKRGLTKIVIHSFTHLGGDTAEPALARALMEDIAKRLRQVDLEVWCTPFGWVCEWELAVHGESLAKVFKAL